MIVSPTMTTFTSSGIGPGGIGDGKMALLGCTVTPGFDYSDYHNASYEELAAKWPAQKEWIRALTRT